MRIEWIAGYLGAVLVMLIGFWYFSNVTFYDYEFNPFKWKMKKHGR